jgi:hypothetical protein
MPYFPHRFAALLPDQNAQHQAAHAQHGQHRADHIDVPRTRVGDVMDEFDGLFARSRSRNSTNRARAKACRLCRVDRPSTRSERRRRSRPAAAITSHRWWSRCRVGQRRRRAESGDDATATPGSAGQVTSCNPLECRLPAGCSGTAVSRSDPGPVGVQLPGFATSVKSTPWAAADPDLPPPRPRRTNAAPTAMHAPANGPAT